MLCEADERSAEFWSFVIRAAFFQERMNDFAVLGGEKVDLFLAAEPSSEFVDQRGPGRICFARFEQSAPQPVLTERYNYPARGSIAVDCPACTMKLNPLVAPRQRRQQLSAERYPEHNMDRDDLIEKVFNCVHCEGRLPFERSASGKFYRFPPTIGAVGKAQLLFVGINPRVSDTNRDLHDTLVDDPAAFARLSRNLVTRRHTSRPAAEKGIMRSTCRWRTRYSRTRLSMRSLP